MIRHSILTAILCAPILVSAKDHALPTFKKIQLTDKFWSEGANIGDFNRDGKMDVVAGPFWYEGPDFKKVHEYYPATEKFTVKSTDGSTKEIPGFEGALGSNNVYSKNFFAFAYDFNKDGWQDILIIGFPGAESWWFENPKNKEGHWARHTALEMTDNESPTFTDLTGDKKPEIICMSHGSIGYAEPDWKHPENPFVWHSISPNNKYQRFTHGFGVGDVDGDGRQDILEKDGWWEQPKSLEGDPMWKQHKYPFSTGMGGAQMYAYDVDGDGLNDVITSIAAHGFGLVWHEQLPRENKDDEIKFREHIILNKTNTPNEDGISFAQLHAVDLVDMNGDGLKDIVTGKRFWAHGAHGDADPNSPAVLYWFELTREKVKGEKKKTVKFIPHLINDDSGVGTQVVAADVNGDKLPDVIVGNKKGAFVHIQGKK